jgi:hypothetical protein
MSETSDRLLRRYQAQERRFLERRFPLAGRAARQIVMFDHPKLGKV